jgi:hypothetical protein
MGILLQESTLHELVMVLLLAIRSVQVFAALQIWLTMHSFLICCYISRTFIEWKRSLAIYWLDKMNCQVVRVGLETASSTTPTGLEVDEGIRREEAGPSTGGNWKGGGAASHSWAHLLLLHSLAHR